MLTKKNKVTFFVSTISNGGAEAVCVNIANGLAERGLQVDLLVLHTNEKNYIDKLSHKVNLIDLKAQRTRYAAPALLFYLLKYKPKILLVFKYELIDLIIILKKIFRLNIKVIGRNISIFSENNKLKKSIIQQIFIKRIFGIPMEKLDCIINQSYEMEKDLLTSLPSLKERSVVIHNPVASYIEQFAKQNDLDKSSNISYILCIGRLEEVKAFHLAIEAFSIIANNYKNLRLKFVGEGSLKFQLKQKAEQLGLKNRIDFEGFQTDVIPYYRHANLTLLTSKYEGFPNVLIESIVLGTPVVSVDCPSGPREILDYGKYGKLVKPDNIQDLVSSIESILNFPNQYNLSERASFFSVDKAIEKYIKLLIEVSSK
ncbi:hypothetical protein GCM10011450_24280 [Advenella faeciporci]|uniref:Glycosyltransferase n=1 Tax=Advenella faeciporci TaxID=797535 RepID=A0A918N0D5_9BURK|nr:glycosyltransferase [Advenella faeciporci]GGW93394.1 hypothetical protein GCM10011450_24280 [Advenella faeciporci]